MERRTFLGAMAGGLLAAPLAARAQQPGKVYRIGYLGIGGPTPGSEAWRQGMRDLGWVEGQNLLIEFRWADSAQRLPELAAELVRLNVDLIFAPSSTQVEAARRATITIPIVFSTHADPVGVGHVKGLARPGGNITGLAQLLTELSAKGLELLSAALPRVSRVGVVWNPTTPSHPAAVKAVQAAAEKLALHVQMVPAETVDDFEPACSAMARERLGGFLVVASPLTYVQGARLAEVALKHRLPGMFGFRENVEAGGLMSYGANLNDLNRRAATYVDKILKGAKPGDLPVEQATKFDLVINRKTAKALGLTIQPSLLQRADQVIDP
jgi:putative ABC transport system substrate-binding protein